MRTTNKLIEFNDEIAMWVVDHSTIHFKAVTAYGDPVELNKEEVQHLIKLLEELLIEID